MTDPIPDWATAVPPAEVHNLPPGSGADFTRPFTNPQLLSIGKQLIEQFLKKVVLAVVGVFVPGVGASEQLTTWASGVFDKFDKIFAAFSGIDLTNPGSILHAIALALEDIPVVGDLAALIDRLANGGQPVNGLNIFGTLLDGLVSKLSIGVLTDEQPDMEVSGDFGSPASIYDNVKWIRDSTVTASVDGTGSARTFCDGTLRAMRSKTPNSVAAGQKVSVSAKAKTAALTGAGATLHLDMVRFSGTPDNPTQIGIDVLATWSPGTGDHDWHLLSADYTIPSGTTCIARRVVVDATCLGGTVWFDEIRCKPTGKLQLSWMPEAAQKFLSIFNVFGTGGGVEQLQTAWNNLLGVLGLSHADDLQGTPDISSIWSGIANGPIQALGFFANLVGGKLPDSQKPAWLQNLTDGIGNLFHGSSDSNLAIPNALDSLNGMWGTGKTAQSSADNANIGVQIINARLEAPGVVGFDEFDYVNGNTLPSSDYALSSSGPGAGNYGPNGKGQLEWKPSGFLQRQKIYKQTTLPLSSDNGVVTAVWSTRIKDPLFSDGFGYLCGRMFNSNNDTRIQAAIGNNSARIQAVNSGVVAGIGSAVTVDTSDGDVWEFWFGILTNAYKMWLKQNGTTVLSVEDTGHISQVGANYRMCGLGGQADNYAAIFQIPPPTVNGWTWRDQNKTVVG
jgi:hypothetical protein